MRWLIALDESEFSERLIGWMRTFPHPEHTEVTVVHVLEPLAVPEMAGARGEELVRQQQGSMVEALLDRARALLAQSFETVEVILREGVPSQEILDVIQQHQPDLVVSGMRGFYQSAGFAFGSVSQRLLAYAPCSLMLVPGKVTSRLGLRVMVATDGSPDALRAAGLVKDLPGVREIIVSASCVRSGRRKRCSTGSRATKAVPCEPTCCAAGGRRRGRPLPRPWSGCRGYRRTFVRWCWPVIRPRPSFAQPGGMKRMCWSSAHAGLRG